MSDKTTMTAVKQVQSEPGKPPFPSMVRIPGGTFLMGSDKHYPEESRSGSTVRWFAISEKRISNRLPELMNLLTTHRSSRYQSY